MTQFASPLDLSASTALFIGFTARISNDRLDFRSTPMKIMSIMDFEKFFGGGVPEGNLAIHLGESGEIVQIHQRFCLYSSLDLYFRNGGGAAFVLTAGTFEDGLQNPAESILQAIEKTTQFPDANLLAIPDAHLAGDEMQQKLLSAALESCAFQGVRMVLWDCMPDAGSTRQPDMNALLAGIPLETREYGAATGPWAEAHSSVDTSRMQYSFPKDANSPEIAAIHALTEELKEFRSDFAALSDGRWVDHAGALGQQPLVQKINDWLADHAPLLPISGAIAGAMVAGDRANGCWVPIAGARIKDMTVASPALPGYNGLANVSGKVLLRSALGMGEFKGRANPLYISRLIMYLRDNCMYYLSQFQGWPNYVETWQQAANQIAAILHHLELRGAFAGESSQESWNISIGIGTTMSEEQASSGLMIVQIQIAPVIPSEFIILMLEQQLLPWQKEA